MSDLIEMKAYEEQINIPLFNEVLLFIEDTADANSYQLRELHGRCLFYRYNLNWKNAVQEKYGFLYLGEMLERYEERFSMPDTDLRAIALALAFTNGLQTENMFIGNQKAAFLQKVRRQADGDIYLEGALYLLSEGTSSSAQIRETLLANSYSKTEELLFVLSLFPSLEDVFPTLKPQLLRLFGSGRSLPVLGNAYLFNWLIVKLKPVLKTSRGNDMALFRAMCALPASYVKHGDKHHRLLLQCGYTPLEIVYLSAMAVQYQSADHVLGLNSVVTEKIIVALFNEALSCKNAFDSTVYEHLSALYIRYAHFKIKCYGASTLDKALEPNLRIQNCDTFLWFSKHLSIYHRLFRAFDIMDSSWDRLAEIMDSGEYLSLFENVSFEEMEPDDIRARIQRYDQLTGTNYLDSYYETDGGSQFSILVKKGIINLWQAFHASLDGDGTVCKPEMIRRIRDYLSRLQTVQAFRFYEAFLPQYGFQGLERYFCSDQYRKLTFSDGLVERFYYNNENKNISLRVTRDFLNDDEQRALVFWLEEYLLYYNTDWYLLFIKELLPQPNLAKLFPKEHLRALFDLIIDQPELLNHHEKRKLMELYLTDEEKAANAKAEEIAMLERQQREKERAELELKAAFARRFDGSLQSAWSFMEQYDWRADRLVISCGIVRSHLPQFLTENNYCLNKQEFARFLLICSKLMDNTTMSPCEAQDMISRIKEVSTHDTGNA